MSVSHKCRLNELVSPYAIPDALNVACHMFPIHEVGQNMGREVLHSAKVVEAIPCIMGITGSKVKRKHLPECCNV